MLIIRWIGYLLPFVHTKLRCAEGLSACPSSISRKAFGLVNAESADVAEGAASLQNLTCVLRVFRALRVMYPRYSDMDELGRSPNEA